MKMWLLKVKLIKKFSLLTKQTISATIFFLVTGTKATEETRNLFGLPFGDQKVKDKQGANQDHISLQSESRKD